ncbi:MAG: hypothetical protein Q9164_006967 [Protoblastenia rupestris]
MQEEPPTIPAPPAPLDLEPRLVHIGDIRFEIGDTSLAGDTPRGTFLYVPITGGYFNTVFPLPAGVGIRSSVTEGLRAKILQGGSDYPLVYKNQLTEINVNTVAQGINTPHIFRITSYGLCEWNPLVFSMIRAEPDARSSQFGEVNSWQVFRINTDSADYAWLNFALIIGQEKLIYEDGRLAATRMKLYQFLVR